MKIMMIPSHTSSLNGESGIHTIVRKYAQHFPEFGLELVSPKATSFDVLAVHAGMTDKYGDGPMVAHLHGLYWTADYPPEYWQFKANRDVINAIRNADVVTVPSNWVSKTIKRDMRFSPIVVPHGIDFQEWQHDFDHDGYVLWNKNRAADVCDPAPVKILAEKFPSIRFLTTFAPPESPPNVKAIGVVPHDKMRSIVQRAWVYLATTKETFGIGTLEAMASGVPVLGYNYGGTKDIVRHEQDGYLANPNNTEDLSRGLLACIANRNSMGSSGVQRAQSYGWHSVIEQLTNCYEMAVSRHNEDISVTVVIPCFNKASTVERAVNSVYKQDLPKGYRMQVVIVDNNSTDDSAKVISNLQSRYSGLVAINEKRQGVAHARNAAILNFTDTKYCCCLDADDEILPGFLRVCIDALEQNRSLGLAYTKLITVMPDGSETLSMWPSDYDYDQFIKRRNQVPTCCVFRTDLAKRLGGYRQRYAPRGAGSEDAEFFLRMGSIGYGGKLASPDGLFRYHVGGATTDPGYNEPDWLIWHPWAQDEIHPFASVATPRTMSHKVYQHDNPIVSVIIPVGPRHQYNLYDALDSLEAQSFRRWEAIVVLDCEENNDIRKIKDAYPYVTFISTGNPGMGAGFARNLGAKSAESEFLVFLDADDSLLPEAISNMIESYRDNQSIIYGDYLGRTFISDPNEIDLAIKSGTEVAHYNKDTGEAIIVYNAADYDCERAQKQPALDGTNFYIWCLICSLVPKAWHDEIGGFDEEMESWEDWDYWIRMAKNGKCFTRVMKPLAQYRFYTGTRRVLANPEESGDTGRQVSTSLLQYMSNKYKEKENMPCTGCGGGRRKSLSQAIPPVQMSQNLNLGATENMSELVLVKLVDNNQGSHPIAVQGTQYGYRRHGDEFYMQKTHANVEPRVILVEEKSDTPEVAPPPPPAKEEIQEEIQEIDSNISLDDIPGIGDARKKKLVENNIHDILGLLSQTPDKLAKILGTTERSAKLIIGRANKKLKEL